MTWPWFLLTFVFALDAIRLRMRLRSLPVLPSGEQEDKTGEFLCFRTRAVKVDVETAAAGAAYARAHGLELVDLVPGDTPALELIRTFYTFDPRQYRAHNITRGHTSGYCLIVSRKLVERSGVDLRGDEIETAELYRLARLFKKYAKNRAGVAIAPGLRAPSGGNGSQRWPIFFDAQRSGANFLMLWKAFLLTSILMSLSSSPQTGLMVIGAWHLQLLVIFAGLKCKPGNFAQSVIARLALDLRDFFLLCTSRVQADRPVAAQNELRTAYAKDLAGGLDRLFEKRREDCPLCGERDLRVSVDTTDLFQAKPGRFKLERCATCGHVFQNPRLSLAGLEFYYRDFYDGLGAADTEALFQNPGDYYRRASAISPFAQPKRWLDVGASYGHFCCCASSVLPDTEFHGVEMTAAIDEAVRTGWVDRGFRGLLPEMAPRLRGQYDVVSLFHCLEHVLDPAEEIQAAHEVLAPGGLIFIEVPNPDCWFGKLFGRFWMPWVQPQHLNMLSTRNLDRLLRKHGFEPLVLEGTYVQQQFDFAWAAVMVLKWLAPRTGMPWQQPVSAISRLRRLVWIPGFPVLVLATLADFAFRPLARRFRIASTYRLIARRVDTSDAEAFTRLSSSSQELQFQ